MVNEESDRLLVLMDEAILQSRRSRRNIEREMGVSQGYLGSLFKGRIQLKVSHVYALSRVLGLEPLTFFAKASPPKNPDEFVQKLMEGGPKLQMAPPSEAPPTRSEIQEMIKTALRTELERLNKKK